MQVTLYTTFSKRKNSTKQPTGGTVVNNVELKRPTSLHDPIFVLGAVTGVVMENITYVKAFNHYYFVTNISVTPNNYFEISCSEDPMASNKTEILSSTQFVVRSASAYNIMLQDAMIMPTDNKFHWVYHSIRKADLTALKLDTTGCYVVTAVSCKNAASSSGLYAQNFVTRYLVNAENIKLLGDYLFDTQKSTWNDFVDHITKMVEKPYDALISIFWLPIPYGPLYTGQSEEPVQLGEDVVVNNDTPVASYLIPQDASYSYKGSVTPTWNYINDWRLTSPYTTASVFIPGFGLADINPNEYKDGLDVETYIDIMTGETITKFVQNSVIKATYTYSLATEIPVAQTTPNTGTAISQIAGGLGSMGAGAATLASGNILGVAGVAAGAFSTATGAMNLFATTESFKGSQGGKAWIDDPEYYLTERYVDTQALTNSNTTNGRPLMEQKQLSTLSGFCQCANASVSLNCMESDRDYINGCLNSGFFIE